jgi:hypothetical protein
MQPVCDCEFVTIIFARRRETVLAELQGDFDCLAFAGRGDNYVPQKKPFARPRNPDRFFVPACLHRDQRFAALLSDQSKPDPGINQVEVKIKI